MKYKRKKATFGVLAPNIQRGGMAIPLGNNLYWMKGRKHKTGGIDIGKDLEVENNEVMQMLPNETRVFSSVKMLGGNSPAELVASGVNPNMVFNAQEEYKRINRIKDDGSRYKEGGRKRAKEGTNKDEINIDLPGLTVYQPIQKEIPNFIEQAIYETGSKLEDVWNIPGMTFAKDDFDSNGRLVDSERAWYTEHGDIYKNEPLKYSLIRKILDENETKFAINAFGELVPKSVIMDKARELEHAWRMENDRAYRDKIEHNNETYEQYYDRMQNAPIASNVDLDKELAWQYEQNLNKQRIRKNKAGIFGAILGEMFRHKDEIDEINNYLSAPWVRNAIEQARRDPEKSKAIMSQIKLDWVLRDYEKYKNGNLPIIEGSNVIPNSTPQSAFLLDRDIQRQYMIDNGFTEAPGDYGLVRKAVGDRNIPVYQQMSDAITRDKLTPIGNLFNYGNGFSDPAWLANSSPFEDAGDYPTALYVDKDGNFYQKAWDLNDYSGTTGRYGVGLDLVGNPVVVTTGFQPVDKSKILELENNSYFEPTEEWEGALSKLKQQSKKYGGKQMNLQNIDNPLARNNKRMISPNKLGTIVRVDGNGRDRLAYIPSTGSSKQDMKCGGRVKAETGLSWGYYPPRDGLLFGEDIDYNIGRDNTSYRVPLFASNNNRITGLRLPTLGYLRPSDTFLANWMTTANVNNRNGVVNTQESYGYVPRYSQLNLGTESDNNNTDGSWSQFLTNLDIPTLIDERTHKTNGTNVYSTKRSTPVLPQLSTVPPALKDLKTINFNKLTPTSGKNISSYLDIVNDITKGESDWQGYAAAGVNALGSVINSLIMNNALRKQRPPVRPIPKIAQKLKTKYNINPQLSENREATAQAVKDVVRNIGSSQVSRNLINNLGLQKAIADNKLFAERENKETELINKDIINRQSIDNENVEEHNKWEEARNDFYNNRSLLRAQNWASLVNGLGSAIGAGLGNIGASRRYRNNMLIAMLPYIKATGNG